MPDRPDINLSNYKDHKPSELIECALFDLDNIVHAGIKIKMDSWFGTFRPVDDSQEKIFTACLGGAVLYGMIPEIKELMSYKNISGSTIEMDNRNNAYAIAYLFDEIRALNLSKISGRIVNLYDLNISADSGIRATLHDKWKGRSFHGLLNESEIEELKKSIQSLVDALKSINL